MKIKMSWLSLLVFLLYACSPVNRFAPEKSGRNLDALLDTLLPYFAKLHDSIPVSRRFDQVYSPYMQVHKTERDYRWLYYTHHSDGNDYFMIRRREPSIKNDKYAAFCGRFKRRADGSVDTATYEELFWTWKMKEDVLLQKSEVLFGAFLEQGNVDRYLPGRGAEDWVEFPGNGVTYDRAGKTWVLKPGP